MSVNVPLNHRKPAKGITASLGTGTIILSRAMRTAIPASPSLLIIATEKVTKSSVIPIFPTVVWYDFFVHLTNVQFFSNLFAPPLALLNRGGSRPRARRRHRTCLDARLGQQPVCG